tara:strand:+ start:1238 stop:1462 length:225 start_codon:yes stop_codon:yes gene_type:complete
LFFFLLNKFIQTGAGDENRTHTTSLEGWCSTIELHPRKGLFTYLNKKIQHKYMVEGEGLEPSKAGASGFTARPI